MDSLVGRQTGVSHNLPARLTSFVGREREVADVTRLLGEHRLVTLVGAPGVGKTRLALRLAGDMVPAFAHGVWLVQLAPLSGPRSARVPRSAPVPSLIPQAVAAALRVGEQPTRPLMVTLAEHLEQRELLLVLDNCEHLVAACASLAEALLQACPTLRILATSREALRIEGEVTWRVPSLTTPDSDAVAAMED
jgi:predicted ATPase